MTMNSWPSWVSSDSSLMVGDRCRRKLLRLLIMSQDLRSLCHIRDDTSLMTLALLRCERTPSSDDFFYECDLCIVSTLFLCGIRLRLCCLVRSIGPQTFRSWFQLSKFLSAASRVSRLGNFADRGRVCPSRRSLAESRVAQVKTPV